MSDGSLEIACGPRDDNGCRLVVATCNGRQHRDTFDTNNEWRRQKFREKAIAALSLPEEAHGFIQEQIVSKADAADAAPAERETPIVKPASEFTQQTVDWLWHGYLPAAAISIIDGDPGLGKSQLTCWLAAAVSRSRVMPDGSRVPDSVGSGVVMLSAEDDPSRTIRPRLDAVEADCGKVQFFAGIETFDGDERGFVLPRDVEHLDRVIRQCDAGLVVIDPFVAYLDSGLSMNCDADVRRALKPLSSMAEATGAAVILLRHLNKKDGSATMYRGGGSIGIIGAARAAYAVGRAEDDPTLRIMAPVKMNLAPMPPSMTFCIEPHAGTSRVEWGTATDVTADALLTRSKPSGTGKMAAAVEAIAGCLANGPRGEREVFAACEDAGVGRSTYWRARKHLGVESEKTEFDGEWMLSIPADSQEFQVFD